MSPSNPTYNKNEVIARPPIPNYWDFIALILVVGLILLLSYGAKQMMGHYQLGQTITISLHPSHLPHYALRTFIRMIIALGCSLIFTFIFGTWAAKSPQAERLLIPLIDILQSVPVLGFLSIAIVSFIALFRGSLLGPECAAVFVIFTSQVWNMTLSFYQSLLTIPKDVREAAAMFRLSAWQRFWRIEVPFAMPGLIWNSMMSMSGSWIFLVAAEAISVAQYKITLPGIGSYIALAILEKNMAAIGWAILTMFIVIMVYDQLLFRPLVAWSEKFKAEETGSENVPKSWLLDLFHNTHFFRFIGYLLSTLSDRIINAPLLRSSKEHHLVNSKIRKVFIIGWYCMLVIFLLIAAWLLSNFIFTKISVAECKHVTYLGLITAIRVIVLIILSSLFWVPIGIYIGLHPRLAQVIQPIIQFLAAFPANLFFPIIVSLIVIYHLNVNIWVSPLMILGTQWYILFNVIAGTSAMPINLLQAVDTLNVSGWLWWRRCILPGIFPYYITGAITAAGGAWNISIIAEVVNWGNTRLQATGIGAYIANATTEGDFQRLALGIVIMSLYVLTINRILWRPLYRFAEERYQIR